MHYRLESLHTSVKPVLRIIGKGISKRMEINQLINFSYLMIMLLALYANCFSIIVKFKCSLQLHDVCGKSSNIKKGPKLLQLKYITYIYVHYMYVISIAILKSRQIHNLLYTSWAEANARKHISQRESMYEYACTFFVVVSFFIILCQ